MLTLERKNVLKISRLLGVLGLFIGFGFIVISFCFHILENKFLVIKPLLTDQMGTILVYAIGETFIWVSLAWVGIIILGILFVKFFWKREGIIQ